MPVDGRRDLIRRLNGYSTVITIDLPFGAGIIF